MLKGERCFTSKCSLERRNVPPGHNATAKRRPKKSDRGVQLHEKQKARYSYGMMERQFIKFFAEAERIPGVTTDNLLILLERRLDNVVFRLGFGDSRDQARQLVRHGHLLVNGRRADVPSYLVKAGDVVTWKESSAKSEYYKILAQEIGDRIVPGWLALDKEKMTGKVLSLPAPTDIETKFDAKVIVEYYSR